MNWVFYYFAVNVTVYLMLLHCTNMNVETGTMKMFIA